MKINLTKLHLNQLQKERPFITSTYLAKSVEMLEIGETIILDIDSEMHLTPCKCDIKPCTCRIFSTPIRAFFDKEKGL
jgi:hypothetical protein